jgi:hypothetical protein
MQLQAESNPSEDARPVDGFGAYLPISAIKTFHAAFFLRLIFATSL